MKVAVNELSGIALDWAVTSIVAPDALLYGVGDWRESRCRGGAPGGEYPHRYGSSWAQGGPIIEAEGILLRAIRQPGHELDGVWLAMPAARAGTCTMVSWVRHLFKDKGRPGFWPGETALVAAMRCFVASKLGNEIELPEGML